MQIPRMTLLLVGTHALLGTSLVLLLGCSESVDPLPPARGSAAAKAIGGGGPRGGAASTESGGAASAQNGVSSTGGTGSGTGGTSASASAPTWSTLYASYFGPTTIGHCTNCHAWANSATGTYDYLQRTGAIDGTTNPPLVTRGRSVLKWFGGTMPQDTAADSPQATADFLAWAAAGAKRD